MRRSCTGRMDRSRSGHFRLRIVSRRFEERDRGRAGTDPAGSPYMTATLSVTASSWRRPARPLAPRRSALLIQVLAHSGRMLRRPPRPMAEVGAGQIAMEEFQAFFFMEGSGTCLRDAIR